MAKLTLSVDQRVIERAKRYASQRRTSVSQLVEAYLDLLARSHLRKSDLPPVTRRLHGILSGSKVDPDEYLDHLEKKYR